MTGKGLKERGHRNGFTGRRMNRMGGIWEGGVDILYLIGFERI